MSFTRLLKQSTSARNTSSFTPKRYQVQAIEFGLKRPAAGFFLAPGLGKTAIILHIYKVLRDLGYVDTLFVLASRRIVYGVWPHEIKKWRLPFRVGILHGKEKSLQLEKKRDVYLMNYEGLSWLVQRKGRSQRVMPWAKKFFEQHPNTMLVIDESSKVRNTRTERFKKLKKLLPRFARRYILTGSPTPKGLINLFGQVYVLDLGESLGAFITQFRNEYFTPAGYMGRDWVPQDDAEERIFKVLRPQVLRFSTDELDMPPLKFINRWVELPRKARRAYNEMEQEFITLWEDGEITAANAAVASGKCRQIANGGIFTDGRERKWQTIHEAKCEDLAELLEELQGEPALIACEFRHDKARFDAYARKHAPEFANAPVIDGATSDRDAGRYQSKWEDGELPVLWGNPASIAHGLNLQGKGGIVIYFSLTWNLEDYEQFYMRVWRQGQRRRVLVYRILAHATVDEVVLRALKIKDQGQRRLLRAMETHYELQ